MTRGEIKAKAKFLEEARKLAAFEKRQRTLHAAGPKSEKVVPPCSRCGAIMVDKQTVCSCGSGRAVPRNHLPWEEDEP